MALPASIFIKPCFHQGVYMPTSSFNLRRLWLASKTPTVATALQPQSDSVQEVFRPLADFPADIWGDYFTSMTLDNLEFESWCKEVEVLKKKVKGMLMGHAEGIDKILFINSLCRLGVSYHFEIEIEEQLSCLLVSLLELFDDNDIDLETVATAFQVFRLNGYDMRSDIFNKFKNSAGMFMEELAGNVKGILSLYEACQFRTNGEKILDEALAFTTKHLEALATQPEVLCPNKAYLQEYIVNSLNRPYHKGMPRVEARQYISFYEKQESPNETLLMFAKLDFNRVQFLHRQELSIISSWSKDINIASRLSYARNRVVEIFFWAIGFYFEPCYANARNVFAKLLTILGYIDDTYDAYATFPELQCFTDAIQRWDIKALDHLPSDCLKILYGALLNVYDEVEKMVSKEGRSYSMSFTKEELKKIVISYLQEAKWTHEGYLPTFGEYLDIALHSSAAILVIAQVLVGMEEADANAFKWLKISDSKSLRAIEVIARLYDDIVTNEDEENRGLVACGIKCYMKQYGVSKEKAIEEFGRRLVIAWKDLNEDYVGGSRVVPKQILQRVVNIARVIDLTYKDEDGFTMSEKILKHHITNVLLHPIPI